MSIAGKLGCEEEYYDANGNRVSKEEKNVAKNVDVPKTETQYTYDQRNCLVGERWDLQENIYAYDLAGNRISRTIQGKTERYVYNNRNQLEEYLGVEKKYVIVMIRWEILWRSSILYKTMKRRNNYNQLPGRSL